MNLPVFHFLWSKYTSLLNNCHSFIFFHCSFTPHEYPFVEEPSPDFCCPVTYDVMVQPHRTSCCKQNLSDRAVLRIQWEGKPCPLCKRSDWTTQLNKELQDKVGSLTVFCPNIDRGCQWEGELRDFDSHIESCSLRDAPLLTSSGYRCIHTYIHLQGHS